MNGPQSTVTLLERPAPTMQAHQTVTLRRPCTGALLVILALLARWAGGTEAAGPSPWTIHVGAKVLTPAEGSRALGPDDRGPFVIQLYQVPTPMVRKALHAGGLQLLRYLGAGAYLGRCPQGCSPPLLSQPWIRATAALHPAMKRSSVFDTDARLAELIAQGRPLSLLVRFQAGTNIKHATALLDMHGVAASRESYGDLSTLPVLATWEQLQRLLGEPAVMWVDPGLPPVIPLNADAAARTRVTEVCEQPAFLNADGSGITVGVWDWFPTTTHTDMEDRVTWVNVEPGQLSHGQMVSGTLAGAGLLDPRAKGMAPGAQLVWHTCNRDTAWSDMHALQLSRGVTITNNSWGIGAGWWSDAGDEYLWFEQSPWLWGYYHQLAAGADVLVRSADMLVVMSAGNSRLGSTLGPHFHSMAPHYDDRLFYDVHPPNPDFGSISGAALAKNVLTAGATTKDDVSAQFSSRGPTADGRLKPDVVTPAVETFTTDENDGYTTGSGTSLAAPVISGMAALLSDYAARRLDVTLTSLELKNLIIHSARDLGLPGPDYVTGHGMADAELAARVLDSARFGIETPAQGTVHRIGSRRKSAAGDTVQVSRILTTRIDHDETIAFDLLVPPGCSDLRATLAWHDPEADLLVNDIDLWLETPDASLVQAFVLDPSHPDQTASRGTNVRDNVERVGITNPLPGAWRVVVHGSRVSMGPETVSVIASAGDGNTQPQTQTDGRCEVLELFATTATDSGETIAPQTVFHRGDPLSMFFAIGISENADYGSFFGSVTLVARLCNAAGELVTRTAVQTQSIHTVERIEELGSGLTIPAGLPLGPYTVDLTVTMANGYSSTASSTISVQ